MTASEPVRVRAGDAEREATAERLRDAHTEGRLRYDELDERLGRAYEATHLDELPGLVADLPLPDLPAPTPARSWPAVRWPAPLLLLVLAGVVLAATGHPPFVLLWVGLWLLLRRRSVGRRRWSEPAATRRAHPS